LGAFDYVQKPVTQEMLLHVTSLALKHKALIDENEKFSVNLEAIFRSVKDGIVTVDREMRVLEMNKAAETLCGYSKRKALNNNIQGLPSGCSGKCIDALAKAVAEKRTVEVERIECRLGNRPGQVVTVSATPLLNRQNAFSGAVMVLRDETKMAALEADMRDAQRFHTMIGRSEAMQRIYTLIDQLADYQTTVLIRGESGTGKELVAEAIHHRGLRSSWPLVKVNCAALPENLLESELFGHVKGAFTGAIKDKIGRFQRADGGTIFLDEIADISRSVQMRLLRVLQDTEFERVGDSSPVKVDVRVIAATNRDLLEKVKAGEFREDLYYRLKVVETIVPPLRERKDDIPLLVAHFIEEFNNKFHKSIANLSSEVVERFLAYSWPGNVRELQHVLEHSFVICNSSTITVADLPNDFVVTKSPTDCAVALTKNNEEEMILEALKKTGGNKAKAARILGMSRRTIYRKIDSLDVDQD